MNAVKNKLWLALAGLGLAVVAAPAYAEVIMIAEARCPNWGDSLEQGEVAGRVAWALKCEKSLRTKRQIESNFTQGIKREAGAGVDRTKGYPTYGALDDKMDYQNPLKWFAPKAAEPDCSVLPPNYEVAFFCASGCYTQNQGVLFSGGYEPIAGAREKKLTAIVTLSPDSYRDKPTFKESRVRTFLRDIVPGKQEVITFTLRSGGHIQVTPNHPLVDGEGQIRQATTLRIGEALVKADGTLDPIASIVSETILGRVYNVDVDSRDRKENVVVAQGYLNGSLYYQNDGVRDLNRELLRTTVAHHILN